MKSVLLFLFLALISIDPSKIGKINTAKAQAKAAYQKQDFATAIAKYRYLVDSLGVTEDEVKLNLANAYFQAKDTANTLMSYQPLTQSSNAKIKSVAHQQMGVLANRENKLEEALANFKQALKANPANEDARYNYEMVKKKLEDQKKKEEEKKKDDQNKDKKDQDKDQEKKDQNKENKDQEKKDQEDQKKNDQKDQQKEDQKSKEQKEKEQQEKEQKEKEQEEKEAKDKKEIPPSVADKLKKMDMSEEKAQMILEAMKNQEKQYLQQNKRKAAQPKDKGKPDW